MDQKAWEYLVCLRRALLTSVSGIENADSYLWLDNSTPNSTTRLQLRRILENAVSEASIFCVYVVTRHTGCERWSHNRASDANGYVWSDPFGLNVEWNDPRFIWEGGQMFQGKRYEPCPCSKKIEPLEHHVIDDVIYNPDADLSLCRAIYGVLSDIQLAISEAGDKKPRSGIREYLLRAILQLNDAIMPVTVEGHILAQTPISP